jgi:hypothetical protein
MVQDSIQSGIFEHGNKRSGSVKAGHFLPRRRKEERIKPVKQRQTERKKEECQTRFFMSS